MRFTTAFAALTVLATGASVSAQNATFTVTSNSISNALLLTAPHYGAPNPPWVVGANPGWYYGSGTPPVGLGCILEGLFCDLLKLFPFCLQCPPKHPHTPPPDYMTYGLVDTVADCQAMCDTVSGCTFANAYHDNNADVKGDSTQLTCSLFSKCLPASSADNCGGQTQSNGQPNFITQSYGYCKKKPTA
ncbi:hypothetical protein MIND_00145900 [Mycena indigotica]|uniref:Uncharacterized protein n=1 Tax=Mycena indigotica TaxID=2126181 RepID=A0A8H6TGG3_9AGAR|nr:uncharacterized protein MIND_00145900 [Mycena indigotica]KAF7316272.1 hypothetical protein MIND_00145900 [Mycena indigotica]